MSRHVRRSPSSGGGPVLQSFLNKLRRKRGSSTKNIQPRNARDLMLMQFYEDACLVKQKFVMADDQSVQVQCLTLLHKVNGYCIRQMVIA